MSAANSATSPSTRWLVFLALPLLFLASSCNRTPAVDASIPPDAAFRLFAGLTAGDPIPQTVTQLQGGGTSWSEYSASCRFVAPPKVIDEVIATGYQPTTWAAISDDMTAGAEDGSFSPPWNPASLVNPECYTRTRQNGEETETHHLAIDRATGEVYAVGESSQKR